jgi:hypothetical protein
LLIELTLKIICNANFIMFQIVVGFWLAHCYIL